MVPRGDTASEQELSKALHDIPQVENITSYVDTVGEEIPMEYLDQDSLSQLVSDNYSRFIIPSMQIMKAMKPSISYLK